MLLSKSHHQMSQSSAVLALVAAVIAAEAEPSNMQPDSDSALATDQYTSSPKRQYLIAPRIGRSPMPKGSSGIWSALEEASFIRNGQVQPQKPYPGPLRSSLLFLVGGNQRLSRSTGLLPQARIGRRTPMGLMPQPRIGRRSYPAMGTGADGDGQSDFREYNQQQEASLYPVASVANCSAISSQDEPSVETAIERPTHRATAFVPRLGKRERSVQIRQPIRSYVASQVSSARNNNDNSLLGASTRMDSLSMDKDDPMYQPLSDYNVYAPDDLALEQMILQQRQSAAQQQQQQQQQQPVASPTAIELVAMLQQMCREAKQSRDTSIPIECNHLDNKRVEFTPRLGR